MSSEPISTDTRLRDLVARSIEIINAEQTADGAYPACSTFPVYRYAWLRDGSFVADALSAHGDAAGPSGFHEWTARVITERADRIAELVSLLDQGEAVSRDRFLPTRYTLAGDDGTEGWWDFQLDGYGTWLWALDQHGRRHADDLHRFGDAIELTTRYLVAAWEQPCYDWWEEHPDQRHVSTLASIQAGLQAALRTTLLSDPVAVDAVDAADAISRTIADEGCVAGRLRKWLGSSAVDGSLLAAVAPFGVVAPGVAERTVAAVEAELLVDGGVHRFRDDVFYGGGRWPVLAGFLGQAYLQLARPQAALAELEWIAGTADDDGLLPEQLSDRLLAPEHLGEWIERWGPVATPLLWSHGAFLSLAANLGIRA